MLHGFGTDRDVSEALISFAAQPHWTTVPICCISALTRWRAGHKLALQPGIIVTNFTTVTVASKSHFYHSVSNIEFLSVNLLIFFFQHVLDAACLFVILVCVFISQPWSDLHEPLEAWSYESHTEHTEKLKRISRCCKE